MSVCDRCPTFSASAPAAGGIACDGALGARWYVAWFESSIAIDPSRSRPNRKDSISRACRSFGIPWITI